MAKTPTYAMEILHDGKPARLTVARAYRPAYAEEVVPAAAAPVAVTVANAPQLSVADELAKLAKLKADGLITQAEFDQQKAKLLAR